MKTKLLLAALCFAAIPAIAATYRVDDTRRQLPTDVPMEATDTPVAQLRRPAAAWPMTYMIEFEHGATIDFADMTQQQPGPLRGYIYLRMQGELVVVPVYRPTPDGTIWRAPEH